MTVGKRDERILQILRDHGAASVAEIALHCNCSEMSVRRDLNRLAEQGLLRRTHGGATLGPEQSLPPDHLADLIQAGSSLTQRSDVIIVTPLDTLGVNRLMARIQRAGKPVVAESVPHPGVCTLVAIDDYAAGLAVGDWAGQYAQDHFLPSLTVLDVTFSQANTAARSRGFLTGLRRSCTAELQVLKLEGHRTVRGPVAKLTAAALEVHPEINIVFCVNDSSAMGAADALCAEPYTGEGPIVVSVGLAGKAGKDLLAAGSPYMAAAAMFPEIVGPACIDAAVCAYHGCALPERLVTPTVVLTQASLGEYYHRDPVRGDWIIDESAARRLRLMCKSLSLLASCQGRPKPSSIGYVEVFSGLDWYRALEATMRARSRDLGIRLDVFDASLDLEEESDRVNRAIGRAAAAHVRDGETVIIDSSPSTYYLALALRGRRGITVISNSLRVLTALADQPDIVLISCGGLIRPESWAATGPGAENALREVRADTAFLSGTGLTADFGLSYADTQDVGVKQMMARAASQVFVLVGHAAVGRNSLVKVLPLESIHHLVSDADLSAQDQLTFSQRGMTVTIAQCLPNTGEFESGGFGQVH